MGGGRRRHGEAGAGCVIGGEEEKREDRRVGVEEVAVVTALIWIEGFMRGERG